MLHSHIHIQRDHFERRSLACLCVRSLFTLHVHIRSLPLIGYSSGLRIMSSMLLVERNTVLRNRLALTLCMTMVVVSLVRLYTLIIIEYVYAVVLFT